MEKDAGTIINENLMRMAENLSLIERFTFGSGPLKNLTTKETHTIALIAALGLPRMSELAGRGHVTLGTMTVMINKLVKKGFVKRVRDDDDRRVVRVGLTAIGRKADRAHAKLHQDVIDSIMGVLTEEEQEQLASLITKITSSFGR
jgi:DNA-binding MarR family transcriptional regulator